MCPNYVTPPLLDAPTLNGRPGDEAQRAVGDQRNRSRMSLFGQFPNAYNAVMRGAQITVRCECGGIGYVPYGQRWQCDNCRRRWNTTQIPADEYWGIMRDMRKLRINVMLTMLGLVVPVVALSL